MITGVALYGFAWVYHRRYNMTDSVKKRFLNPNPPPLIREGDHFSRKDVEDEVQNAFVGKSDSLGLVGVVFGPAGTGKSNVVRTVCRNNEKGVIYMEIGSPRQFPYHLAKACGVPVEPNWWDAVVAKLFGPTFQTYATLPSSDQDALALVLPIIAEGAKAYMAEGAKEKGAKDKDAKAKAEDAKAKAEDAKAKEEDAKAKAEDAKAKAEDAKAKAEDAKAKEEDAKAKAEDAKAKEEDAKAKAEDAKAKAEDAKAKAEDAKAKEEDAKAKAEDAKAKAEDAKAKAEDAKAKAEDAKAKAEDAKAKEEDAKAKEEDAKANLKAEDAKAKEDDAKAKAEDAKAKEEDAKAKAEDAKAKAEDAKAKAEDAKAEDAKAKAEDAKAKAEDAKAKDKDAKAKAEVAKAKAENAKAKAEGAKAKAEDAKAKAEGAKAKAEDAKAKAEGAKAKAEDAKAKAEGAKAKAEDAKAKAEGAKAKAEDAKAKAEGAKSKAEDAKAKAEGAKAKAEGAKAKAEDAKAKAEGAKAKAEGAKAKAEGAKAKAEDAKAKAEDAKAKAEDKKYIPVLFIDGVDILAKEEDNRLYVNLVDWAKKCANEDSLLIVLVCSDSHVLVLDQQSFKSRLDALIEIDDASETQAVNELMMKKYQFTADLAKSTYDIVGGRLADIHKMVSIYKRAKSVVIPQEVVDAKVKELISNFKQQFIREMEQALCKAIGKDKHKIKKFIIQQVLKANGTKTVEEIAFLYNDSTKIHEVIDAIKELLRYNVLRINKDRKLLCYNKTAKEVLARYK